MATRPGPTPPKPVLWLATRLHPAFRRREKLARKALSERNYLDAVDHWKTEREEWIAKNRALQSVDFAGLDDLELADHVADVDRHNLAGWIRHHELHGSDAGPIGDLLAHTNAWGLDPTQGHAVARGRVAGDDRRRRSAGGGSPTRCAAAGVDPLTIRSLDQVRAVPAASAALDDYLDRFGWRVVSSYDIEGLTTSELPAAICTLIRSADARTDGSDSDELPDPTAIREQVDAEHRPLFDELLDGARRAYGLRDDNGPLTAEWPMGTHPARLPRSRPSPRGEPPVEATATRLRARRRRAGGGAARRGRAFGCRLRGASGTPRVGGRSRMRRRCSARRWIRPTSRCSHPGCVG